MKTEIYNYIKNSISSNNINFDQLFKEFINIFPDLTKPVLGQTLRELESEGKITEINKSYIDLQALVDVEGFVHWNLNQLCWIEEKDKTNAYGISFNPQEELLMVYNKRKAFYGSYIKGKILDDGERKSVYILDTFPQKDIEVIAAFNKENSAWHILNSAANTRFKLDLSPELMQEGVIASFKYDKEKDLFFYQNTLGNIADKGMESKIVRLVSEIHAAPEITQLPPVKPLAVLDKPFFTIDSLYTKDIDDAIHIEKSDKGFELWVAIADVSSFVTPMDTQDKHARKQCTSFYFLNDTVHMLSRSLAENYCSLNVGQPRNSMICHLSYDLSGNMLSYEFLNQEITSYARLTYDDVDAILNDQSPTESLIFKDKIIEKLKQEPSTQWVWQNLSILSEFTKLQQKEYKPDYWFVQSPECHVGENGKIDNLYLDDRDGSHSQKMVEVSMLAANMAAAQFLFKQYPHLGMFRNQVAPEQIGERPKPAFYHADNEGHWGLQASFYTHFTSPIRRYCDLLVHHLIKGVINHTPAIYDKEEIGQIGQQINQQQYVAKQASIREKNLLMNQYVQALVENKQLNVKYKIVDFSENGIVVRNSQLLDNFIPAFKLERSFANDFKKIDHENLTLEQRKEVIATLNDNWKIKCFLDDYHWLNDRKETFYKFYSRDFSQENKKDKPHAAL